MTIKSNSTDKKFTPELVNDIKKILDNARAQSSMAINTIMLNAYWKIGERIVNEEQGGKFRADYGSATLKELSQHLTFELGKGFSPRNLQNYRQFYILFPD